MIQNARDLAERLSKAMKAANIDNRAMAEACGVTSQAVSQWKSSGRVHKKHLPVLANLLGKPVQWLLGDEAADGQESELVFIFRKLPGHAREKLLTEARWHMSQLPEKSAAKARQSRLKRVK